MRLSSSCDNFAADFRHSLTTSPCTQCPRCTNAVQSLIINQESELENVQLKLAHINLDTASLSSVGLGDPFLDGGNLDATMESNMEGWLQVPSKQNIRRYD